MERVIHGAFHYSPVYVHILTFRLNLIFTRKAPLVDRFGMFAPSLVLILHVLELGVRGDWQSALFLVNTSFYWVDGGKIFFIFLLLHLRLFMFLFDRWREDEQITKFIFQGIFDRIRDLLPFYILSEKAKSDQHNMIWFPQTLLKKLGLIDSLRKIHRSKAT